MIFFLVYLYISIVPILNYVNFALIYVHCIIEEKKIICSMTKTDFCLVSYSRAVFNVVGKYCSALNVSD